MTTSLDQLKGFTTVVADTGDFALIEQYKPQDATTNPSLLYAAAQKADYKNLVDDAVTYGKANATTVDQQVEKALDKLAVNFGLEILKLIPGRVSTEIDARLSFDTEGTVAKGKELIELYKQAGVDSDRVLLKIASTWEGLQAAKQLEAEGLHCNLTLMFSLEQAMVAGEVKATLISPFAGRITDFYKAKDGVDGYDAPNDPGVKSVKEIYNYLKTYKYETVVMGASFRNKEQVIELAGCDLLTVSPGLLGELSKTNTEVKQTLNATTATSEHPKTILTQSEFLRRLNDNEMAHFKLGEGIRKFTADLVKLEEQVRALIAK